MSGEGPIAGAFRRCAEAGRAAFIPYLMAGYPDRNTFLELAMELGGSCSDVLEVGVPHSDPIADGCSIQSAGSRALAGGTSPAGTLRMLGGLTPAMGSPVVLMTYVNPVMAYGMRRFAFDCAAAGIAGVIVPDLPLEEADEWRDCAAEAGLDTVFLVTPTSGGDRARRAAEASTGFLYYVCLTGVTGGGLEDEETVLEALSRLRKRSGVPVAAGFGVKRPGQAARLSGEADGIVVGTRLIEEIGSAGTRRERVGRVTGLCRSFMDAVAGGGREGGRCS